MPAGSIRARVRAEMTAEIKAVARHHLESDGANLSLRAVARDMGMVSSALYRYFASRDDLLTALIVDAYNALGDTVEAAEAAVADRSRLRDRWRAATRAVRVWALAKPAEYALIYGSPVPGYAAPAETVTAAARTPAVMARILTDGYAAGLITTPRVRTNAPDSVAAATALGSSVSLTEAVRADLARTSADIAPGVPEEVLLLGMTGWIQMFGAVSFELFGQFNNVIEARADFFDLQMDLMADLAGMPPTA
jgi:AcrR family transcriptional regulator